MIRMARAMVLAASLSVLGCSAETPEIGPVKETKQADPEQMKKMMEQSRERNNAGGRGTTVEIPTDDKKTP
jgi:hypothetical protein